MNAASQPRRPDRRARATVRRTRVGRRIEGRNPAVAANPARMAETTAAPLWNENEPAKVESWRLHILLEAGYPVTSRSASP